MSYKIILKASGYLGLILAVYSTLTENLYSQQRSKSAFVMPTFLDSHLFTKRWTTDQGLKQLYARLDKENDYAIFYHGFQITDKGKLVPDKWEYDSALNQLIDEFNAYRWVPAFVKGYKNCKKVSYGTLEIYIAPVVNTIQMRINVGDGEIKPNMRTQRIYNKSISPNLIIP